MIVRRRELRKLKRKKGGEKDGSSSSRVEKEMKESEKKKEKEDKRGDNEIKEKEMLGRTREGKEGYVVVGGKEGEEVGGKGLEER